MLTRTQVAERLGKSVATVRRIEGIELHPRRDSAGVHRFDPAEVDKVARAPRQRFSAPLSSTGTNAADAVEELNELLSNSEDKVRRLERQLATARQEARDAKSAATEENAELREALQIALACVIEHLGPKTPPDIEQVLGRLVAYYSERA